MSMSIVVMNGNVLNLLADDLRDVGKEFSSRGGLRSLMEEIRDEVIIPSIRKNFEVGGRPRWEPLSPATVGGSKAAFIESAASGIIGGRLPFDTSARRLRRSAYAKARFSIRDNVMEYGNWPSTRWFGPVHNLPELAERANIPARPFTLFQREDMTAIQEITGDWVERQVNKHVKRRYA